MRKGDLKKQEILQTAEKLFCQNGYETTGIQEIIDILHTSKGSFYHHYASKEMLLEAICRRRSDIQAKDVVSCLDESSTPLQRLNALFSGMMPLAGEKLSFLMMLLPVFDLPEGRQIRFSYAESLAASFRESVVREIRNGNESGDLYCPDADHAADMCFLILNELWYRLCLVILRSAKSGAEADPAELLKTADAYRGTLERVLSAPYGSLGLLDLEDIRFLSEKIRYHWKLHRYSA